YSEYPDIYRFFMLQIRHFPERFDEDSREVRVLYPIWSIGDDTLPHEILYAALNGMTTKLIEDFQTGSLSADDFVAAGMKRAAEYIAFFKNLDKTQ
ncbi:hypothetical protein LJC27_08495, partial [Christensenellaceae bacterium OttesenSCG-928-M15]|nr:hypothetical protein [Christensenellaceae bacterium OttesenSCG-928-M15]